jgi:hypothetical protein
MNLMEIDRSHQGLSISIKFIANYLNGKKFRFPSFCFFDLAHYWTQPMNEKWNVSLTFFSIQILCITFHRNRKLLMRTIDSYNIYEISTYSLGVLIISLTFQRMGSDGLHLNYLYVLYIIYMHGSHIV